MKPDACNLIARLLAADNHPQLKEEPAYIEAKEKVEASEELTKLYEENKRFFERHPVLVDVEGLPDDARKRIEAALKKPVRTYAKTQSPIPGPWEVRRQFAWAAVLVLLLAGMSVISSHIIQRENQTRQTLAQAGLAPADAFRQFVGHYVENPQPHSHVSDDTIQLVSWLNDHGAGVRPPPESLMRLDGRGCGIMEGPKGRVSVICFDSETGKVHLFMACAKSLSLDKQPEPEQIQLHNREAMQWNDGENVYLLISSETGQPLPEIFL